MKQSSIFSFVAKGALKPETPIVDLFCGVCKHELKPLPSYPTCLSYSYCFTSGTPKTHYRPRVTVTRVGVSPFGRSVGSAAEPNRLATRSPSQWTQIRPCCTLTDETTPTVGTSAVRFRLTTYHFQPLEIGISTRVHRAQS